MQKTILTGILFLLATTPLLAAKAFEGQYDMELRGDREVVNCTFLVKEGNMRMKVSGKGQESGEMIFRNGTSTMIMIVPSQKVYMEMAIPEGISVPPPEEKELEEFPFKKTGETRDILGYKAHEYVMEDGEEKVVIWATEELGTMPYSENPVLEGWGAAMRMVTGLKAFFPLETVGSAKGKETFRMTVRKVEAKALEDAIFLPPEGYMKFSMPAGMGGMMPGSGR